MQVLPILIKDAYKTGHIIQYPNGTQMVYSNLTPRGSRIPGINSVVVFGIQHFVKEYLIDQFDKNFFLVPKKEAIAAFKRRMDNALGKDAVSTEHMEALHDLGYLPLEIKALPEGTLCPMRIPLLTIRNTHDKFFWLTNDLETLLSAVLWHPITSATIAHEYRKMLDKYAAKTSDIPEFVQWQGHDFSMRGQASIDAAMASGAAHLLSFTGTDTIPAIDFLETYYGANSDNELIGGSVPATEHSVMCLGGNETEQETFDRLITKVYPSGIVSIVSDTWDYWKVIGEILPNLKDKIMARDGKVVIRPDSGDPVLILCGDDQSYDVLKNKGTVEALWDLFGGTTNSKGYKQLDPHIGAIYGDSITLERCNEICERLERKGFASTNVVFGIGSFTYQYVTRDTFGFAMKATYGVVNGKAVNIFKNPKTDDGLKKSAKGMLRVNADLTLSEGVTPQEADGGMLQTVFFNGQAKNIQTLSDIRKRLLNAG
jgi:nicotinamide phosphoribosyltransferase